jgi:hypothetical protein
MTEFVSAHRPGGGRVFGFPLEGFGLFTSLLLSFASAFFTFFASTCIAIFSLLGWNVFGHHSVNYADSYLFVGFPAGVPCGSVRRSDGQEAAETEAMRPPSRGEGGRMPPAFDLCECAHV